MALLTAAALTAVGRFRAVNEDAFSLFALGERTPPPSPGDSAHLVCSAAVLAVYDGCGHKIPGQSASHRAASILSDHLSPLAAMTASQEIGLHLVEAVRAAGRDIWASQGQWGMGTTATVAAIAARCLTIAHVGDSRAYLHTAGRLRQLTRDDTLVSDLLEANALSPRDLETFPHRNVVTRVLGVNEHTEIAIITATLQPGDVVLLVTDGVTKQVDDVTIATILTADRRPEVLCRLLLEAAERAGGHDNQTAVISVVE